MEQKFPTLPEEQQYKVLKSYYEAIKAINTIELPDLPYGSILQTSLYPITNPTWPGFLKKMVRHRVQLAGERLKQDVIELDQKVQGFGENILKYNSWEKTQ